MLGKRDLTPDLKAEYDVKENDSHMSLVVPFLALDVAFEVRLPFCYLLLYTLLCL